VAFVEYSQPYYDVHGLWYFSYPNMIFTVMLVFMGLRVFKEENLKYATQIEEQKHALQEKNTEMTDSINYARRIQYTLLGQEDLLRAHLPEYFIYFNPKDIVSGDFYWAATKGDCFYLAVCDSTGHGVPGAFMSLLNISFLNEALNEKHINEPHEILNHVRKRLIQTISQEGAKDGMDAVLICYNKSNGTVTYAAANNAPLLINGSHLELLKKDKMPVGMGEKHESFTLQNLQVKKGDTLYLFTDGYADQFGGPAGKKFKLKQLESVLTGLQSLSMVNQQSGVDTAFENWRGQLEQVDDVCIIGIRF
jgi:serine phosphatase RsbU (regulator of sigma subunit)